MFQPWGFCFKSCYQSKKKGKYHNLCKSEKNPTLATLFHYFKWGTHWYYPVFHKYRMASVPCGISWTDTFSYFCYLYTASRTGNGHGNIMAFSKYWECSIFSMLGVFGAFSHLNCSLLIVHLLFYYVSKISFRSKVVY